VKRLSAHLMLPQDAVPAAFENARASLGDDAQELDVLTYALRFLTGGGGDDRQSATLDPIGGHEQAHERFSSGLGIFGGDLTEDSLMPLRPTMGRVSEIRQSTAADRSLFLPIVSSHRTSNPDAAAPVARTPNIIEQISNRISRISSATFGNAPTPVSPRGDEGQWGGEGDRAQVDRNSVRV
jgi:hypothetical protein